MPDHYQFSIPIGAEDFAEKISFAKEHQFGIEVAAFASGPALADEHLRTQIERRLITALRGFPRRLSYHGAFIDLVVHSADPAIAAVARGNRRRRFSSAYCGPSTIRASGFAWMSRTRMPTATSPWKRGSTDCALADRVGVVLELNSLRAIRQSQAYLAGLRASHAGPATNGPGRFNKRSNPRGLVRAT